MDATTSKDAGIAASGSAGYSNFALFAMLFVVCSAFSSQMVMPMWVGAVIADYGISKSAAGSIASAELFTVAVMSVLGALIINRMDRRLMAFVGIVILIAGNGLSVVTQDAVVLTLLRMLCGIGKGFAVAAVFSTVAQAPNPTRGFALTNAAYAALGAFYFLIIPDQIKSLGAAGAFLVITIVTAAGLVLLPWMPSIKAEKKPVMEDLRSLANPAGLLALVGLSGVMLGHAIVWIFIQVIGTSEGLTLDQIGVVLALSMLVTVAGPATAHILPPRIGLARPIGWALSIKAVLALLLVAGFGPAFYWFGAPAFSVISLFIVPFVMGLLSHIDRSGRLAASGSAAMTLGSSAGSLIGGFTADHLGYVALGWMACLVFALSAVFLLPAARRADRAVRQG